MLLANDLFFLLSTTVLGLIKLFTVLLIFSFLINLLLLIFCLSLTLLHIRKLLLLIKVTNNLFHIFNKIFHLMLNHGNMITFRHSNIRFNGKLVLCNRSFLRLQFNKCKFLYTGLLFYNFRILLHQGFVFINFCILYFKIIVLTLNLFLEFCFTLYFFSFQIRLTKCT